jgi:hypothetical protein
MEHCHEKSGSNKITSFFILHGVTAVELLIIQNKEMETVIMQNNRIWEQVADFMQRLRSENISEKSVVQMPRQKAVQEELEKAQGSGEKLLAQMQENERGIIQKWIERLEDNASLEVQQAYCQGYVDCILLLSGMGLLGTELSGEEILDRIRK